MTAAASMGLDVERFLTNATEMVDWHARNHETVSDKSRSARSA